MGWRYRKRVRLGPLNINLSRRGVGTSWGVPGFRVTHSANGRRYLTLSLPGTGLSWQKTLGTSTAQRRWPRRHPPVSTPPQPRRQVPPAAPAPQPSPVGPPQRTPGRTPVAGSAPPSQTAGLGGTSLV